MQKIADAYPVRELSRVAVVGRKEPVDRVRADARRRSTRRASRARCLLTAACASSTRAVFREARRIFEEISAVDPPAASYVRKCAHLEAQPPEGRVDRRLGDDGEVGERYIRVMSEPHDTGAQGAAPIRLFSSDFFEFFTHVHPAMVPVVWVPLAAVFLWRAIQLAGTGGIRIRSFPALPSGSSCGLQPSTSFTGSYSISRPARTGRGGSRFSSTACTTRSRA